MKRDVISRQINTSENGIPEQTTRFSIEYPDCCTECGSSGVPILLGCHHISKSSDEADVFANYLCTICKRVFTGYYKQQITAGITALVRFTPRRQIMQKTFSDYIQEVSCDFCTIYNQAYAALQNELGEIAGVGYRKALEFLVKDYAIYLNPSDRERIAKLPLSKCITDYIDNKRIKRLATASAWLGNDETHYERKNLGYTIKDLTTFIDSIVSFIESDIASIKAEQLINSSQT